MQIIGAASAGGAIHDTLELQNDEIPERGIMRR
jgi:hypothetical protein